MAKEAIDSTKELETKKISALFWTYALPAVMSQVIASVYSIVDRMFLGQCVGFLALAGLAITMPIMNIIHAFGSLVGAGSSARMSIVLGRKDEHWAEKILGNSMLLTFFFGFIFVVGGYLFMDPILNAFGASNETISYAREYMYIVLPGMFLTTLTFNLTGLIRASGYPNKAMWIMCSGAVLNIILDAVFIYKLRWGITGAAWATTVSMTFSSILAVWHFVRKSSFIRFKRHGWAPKMYIFKNILAIGISPFSMNVAAFLVVALLNKQLIHFGGDLAVSTYGVVNSVCGLVVMLFLGLCQGMQPIAGYNYGAGKNERLREVYLLTMKVCVGIGIVSTLFTCIFPRPMIRCFAAEEPLILMGIPALRYLTIFMPFIAYTIVNSQFFQSIDKPWIAIVTSLSRQVLFLIPLIYIVPNIFIHFDGEGLSGVWAACTASDILGAALSTILLIGQLKVFKPGYVAPARKPRKERGPKTEE